MTRPKLVELGAPKMEDQVLTSRPMSYFTKITFLSKAWFFSELGPLVYVEL
jgi:hypothetical protein